ncbi:putative glycosyltransferase [Sulfolobus filamentous virus 1]|uniref:Putative glycosyltransferase n=1 Tax=Sulfolobus filamentous virus 1 TaxID=2304198 RepID=A0A346LU90_SUFV1|nr:putative glycosyltransferase [Sulfolobus filamentous virus 1]AXQ00133.1 putative glycosyltransferase [Sulfolobus filamentous virus 1]
MLVCIPVGWVTYTEPLLNTVKWANEGKFKFDFAISNRVDLNRSVCISKAKLLKEDLIMIDSDINVLNPPLQLKEILKEDEREADIVLGIAVSHLGVLIDPLPPKDKDLYEINWGSLSFVYIPFKTLRKLKHIAKYPQNINMYMTYKPYTSEDVEFIRRLKKKGFKVMADKRIALNHFKLVPLRYMSLEFEVQTK